MWKAMLSGPLGATALAAASLIANGNPVLATTSVSITDAPTVPPAADAIAADLQPTDAAGDNFGCLSIANRAGNLGLAPGQPRCSLPSHATLVERVYAGGDTKVELGLNGDRAADRSIRLSSRAPLRATDLVL